MAIERQHVSRSQLINQLLRTPHRQLSDFAEIGLLAATHEPELFGHMIAWNQRHGEVRDSKVALPVLALRGPADQELLENAVAHLCLLDPRNLVRAIEYSRLPVTGQVTPGGGKLLKAGLALYLHQREESPGWWDRTALQHRTALKALYALSHTKPSPRAQAVLFKRQRPRGSVFEAMVQLKTMGPQEAAGTILNHRIPFLIAVGAVGGIKNNTDIILALIEQTSGSELLNNTKMFQRLGVLDNPALRAAFDAAIERAKQDKRVGSFKAARAAESLSASGDKTAAVKLQQVQTTKQSNLGLEGDWLVLADRSGSMVQSIEAAKVVAATLAGLCRGSVHLTFFNTEPTRYDVTGKSLEEIQHLTRNIRAGGGTCIGCGLEQLRFSGLSVDGIVIITDGGENTRPAFTEAYLRYVETTGTEPTVYQLWLPGQQNVLKLNCERVGIPLQFYDLRQTDYIALPNLIKTLRTNRYSLADEIMETPLLRLAEVFSPRRTRERSNS